MPDRSIAFSVKQEIQDRKALLFPDGWKLEMNDRRRSYVLEYYHLLGYDPSSLHDEQLTLVFHLLSRFEEYATHIKHNGHNWEVDYATPVRIRQATVPVLENLFDEWRGKGYLTEIEPKQPRWPDGKRFALCLTHDMDHVCGNVLPDRIRSLPAYLEAPLVQKLIILLSTARAVYWKVTGRSLPDPLLKEWLIEEEKQGFTSSMFFLPQPLPYPHWEDSFYRYTDKVRFGATKIKITDAMQEISNSGWDIGLHGSSRSYSDPELLSRERQIISNACGREAVTIRQHHLLCDVRYTPWCQERAGLLADSTFGSHIRTSFRCGTGMPYFLYDFYQDRSLDLLEAPLVIQDVALFKVLQMDHDIALYHCTAIMEEVARHGGAMTILWHNNYQASDQECGVYRELLEQAANMGAWGCSLRDLSNWWRLRRKNVQTL